MPARFRKPKKTHEKEVSAEYLASIRALEESIPAKDKPLRRDQRYYNKQAAKAKGREQHLRAGLRAQNGDIWGNTPYQRRRFLESKIEVSERATRASRMLVGKRSFGSLHIVRLADVRSAGWPAAAKWVAAWVGNQRQVTAMRSSPVGVDDDTS